MDPISWIIAVATNHNILVYGLIIVLTCIEGPIISLVCGFLLKVGALYFIPAYLCLMAGDLAGDIIWYTIGHRWGYPFIYRFGRYFSLDIKKVETVQKVFRRYHDSILFISKLTTGLGFAPVILFTAGLSEVSFRRYMALNAAGQIFWTGGLLLIGFELGNLYTSVGAKLDLVSIIAMSIIVFLLMFGLGKYLGKRFITNYLDK
jgi:membrane protein DedA with SNARE-associated domain